MATDVNTTKHFATFDEDDIPGASLRGKQPEHLTKAALLQWLRCRSGASLKGKKAELVERVKFYIQHGWDTKYLVHPDRHNKKIYSQATIENNSSFLESHPPPAGYTSYLDGVPFIDDGDIHQYFLVKCDDNSATAKKHRDTGWTFFKSGKVISSEFKMDIDDSVLLLRGNVEASFDRGIITGKTKKHYFTYVCCDKHSGTILGGRCFCKAGLGGYCKHVAAVLFHVMDSQRQGYKFTPKGGSKTSNLQTWHQPKVKGRTCIRFSDLAFESFNFERENDCSTIKKQKTDYKNLSSCPDERFVCS
ncbi:uncharacterized protein [Argopecten irradians]|uniref:uncharacterized protein n=1 Tax=Argopecten irradians TaxID=31199 RepID=UPI00371B79A7